MFDQLLSALGAGSDGAGLDAWNSPTLMAEPGYRLLLRTCPDGTLGDGIYRLHDAVSGPWAADWLTAVGGGTGREIPFAYDWLGRQFTLDQSAQGQSRVVLWDPFRARVPLDVGFDEFHRNFLPHNLDDVLMPATFRSWASTEVVPLPLQRDQCAVYTRNPLLGGDPEPNNLRLGTLPHQRELSLFTYSDGRRPGERCEQIVSQLLLSDRLSDALHHEDPFVRAHAIVYWSPTIPAQDLVHALTDESAAVRDAAAMRLMDVEPTSATVAALTKALGDPDPDVRWSAEFALQQLRGDRLQRADDAAVHSSAADAASSES